MESKGRFSAGRTIKMQILVKCGQNSRLQTGLIHGSRTAKRVRKPLFPRGQQRSLLTQHSFPPHGLERIDQLVFLHPLLPGELVFRGKKRFCMGMAQALQCRALRQFPLISSIFQRQPRQIVIGTLADVPRPPGKQALRHGVAEPFMHQSDDAVHVEIRLAVRLHCQKLRLKPIIPTGCPHQIDGPALPGAVASALHINP